MSCRPPTACRILPTFLALLVLCMVPVSAMTIHLPDRDAVSALVTGTPHGSTDPAFRYDPVSGSWLAIQPGSRTGLVVTPDGIVRVSAPAGSFGMQYGGLGRNGVHSFAPAGTIRNERDHLTIDRSVATEWYISGSTAIEQGMTIAARPEGSGPLAVRYTLDGDLQPQLTGETLIFFDATGPVLQYGGITAYDRTGRPLPSRLGLSGTTLYWLVDDRDALYPVTIDPTIAGQTTVLRASPPPANELPYFGCSVSFQNNTALIGAYNDDFGGLNDAGQAYIFFPAGGTWNQMAILNASNKAEGASFGFSVSLWNDTAVVGAETAWVSGAPNRGQAYVFTSRGGSWSQIAILNASNGADYAMFGYSVSLWNDTVLVGAKDSPVGATGGAGQAYIFSSHQGTWVQTAILNATDMAENAHLGNSVFLANDTAIVGAIEADGNGIADAGQVYVFKNSGDAWAQSAILNASDAQTYAKFGWSVGYDNDTIVIGSPEHDLAGKSNAGQAYVFKNNSGTWNQVAILNASDASQNNLFGKKVSISRNTTLVGAPGATVSGASSAGKVYVFNNSGGSWTQAGTLTLSDASSQTDANFGESLWLTNETMALVGASSAKNSTGFKTGQAYVITLAEGFVPEASFTSTNVSVATNSTVQGWAGDRPFTMLFSDTSTNTPTSWAWARKNLTHTTWTVFNTSQNARDSFWPGNWSVNLTATNAGGSNVSVQTLWVNVSQPALTVTGITPSTGQNTTSVSITNLAGTGFYGTPTVNLTRAGQANITATSVTLVSANQLTCTFNLANRIAGSWNVNVTNPDREEAALVDGFTITNTTTPTPTPTPTATQTSTTTTTPTQVPNPSGGSDSGGAAPGQSVSSSGTASIAGGAPAGQTVTYSFGEPAMDYPVTIESISFVPGQSVGQSQCLIGRTGPASGFTIPDRPAVYESIQINWINPGVITEATIQFSVKGSWLREQNIGPEEIVMLRQHDLVWTELPTVFDRLVNDMYYFHTTTPGFSNFAVSVRKNATVTAVAGTAPVPPSSPVLADTVPAATVTGSIPPATPVPLTSPTATPVPVPAAAEPGFPLGTVVLVGAGCIVLIGAGLYVRRWWIRRQNPALFMDYD